MPISFGSANIGAVHAGATPIGEVYDGSRLVWRKDAGWPRSGSWSGAAPTGETVTVSFTVTEAGAYVANHKVTVTSTGTAVMQAYIKINGSQVASGASLSSGPGVSDATMTAKVLQPGDVIQLTYVSLTGSPAITVEWTADYLGAATLPQLLNLDSAKTTKYRVAFAGSSTMQGWGQPRYESTAHLLTARLLRHATGANASQMISQTSGSRAEPTLPGFHFLNAALGGTTSANYLDTTKRNLVNGYGPDLLIHMVGSNDYSEQVAPATYKSRMRTAIQSITGVTRHVLVHQQRREDRADTGYTWAQYGQALRELADELANVYFVDASQRWHTLRNGATDWFAADKIHCTWKGAQGLATAIADEMQLDEHVGETVWAVDPSSFPTSAVSSIAPTSESLVKVPATDGGRSVRPSGLTSTPRSISFNQNGAAYLDTASWGGAYAFPLTFYVVIRSRSTNTSYGTAVQPWFSRSIANDDGWWWAWQDRGVPEVRAALNSAFSGAFNYGFDNFPVIIAVHMAANNRASIFVNSIDAKAVLDPDRIDENPGPWMKSLRIGANSSAASYMSGTFYEMRWEHSAYGLDSVRNRMEQLAGKYGVTLDGAGGGSGKLDTGARDFGAKALDRSVWTMIDSYTVPTDRNYTVNAVAMVNWSSISVLSSAEYQIRLLCEGQVLAIVTERPTSANPMQLINQTVTIPAGGNVILQAYTSASATADRNIISGMWGLAEP